MDNPDTTEDAIILSLFPSKIRYWFGIFAATCLGGLLIWMAAFSATSIMAQAVLIGFGLAALFVANKMYSNQLQGILLTKEGLFDSTGDPLCRMEQIVRVDRNFHALRPSHGFLILLKEPLERRWIPGLWWRYGKHIGVGGLTNSGTGKGMADTIAVMLQEMSDKEAKD